MSFDTSRKRELLCLTQFLALVFCLQVSTELNGQVAGQTVSGPIASESGGPIANARLTLRNPANGETKSIVAANDGYFTLTNLSPGTFEITVSAPGFVAEFFNILNRAIFSPPLDNRNIFDSGGQPIANAGLITSTQTPSRQIQFALKVIW
jgi:Carboxypeptidase regulatory-like domain